MYMYKELVYNYEYLHDTFTENVGTRVGQFEELTARPRTQVQCDTSHGQGSIIVPPPVVSNLLFPVVTVSCYKVFLRAIFTDNLY